MRSKSALVSTRALLAASLSLTAASAGATGLALIDDIEVAGDPGEIHEIVSVDGTNGVLYATFETGIRRYTFDGWNLAASTTLDLSGTFTGDTVGSVSSVALDPLGRGFGAAVVIPNQSHINKGKVVFFDTTSNAILQTLDAGYHPDMVTFAPDGNTVLIANEGEPLIKDKSTGLRALDADGLMASEIELADKPGSLSVIDLSGKTKATLGTTTLSDFDFQAANLGAGVAAQLGALRVREDNVGSEYIDVEPEYVTVQGDTAFVALQENNAVATFDLTTSKWTKITDLGAIEQDKVDVSNEDGPVDSEGDGTELISLTSVVKGLPMPDGLASFSIGSTKYYITANEGDGREYIYDEDDSEIVVYTDEDRMRGATEAGATFGFANPGDEPSFSDREDKAEYGRLKIIVDHITDTDGNGKVETIQAYGARSFTIWDENGNIVFDSGQTDATDLSQITNNAGTYDDGRSDDKGPEPETVEVGEYNGRTYLFVALERTGGVAMFDITDPANATFVTYVTETGESPEGLDFFEYKGRAYLAVAYEGSEDAGKADLEIYQIPEPGSLALLGLGALALAGRRRR